MTFNIRHVVSENRIETQQENIYVNKIILYEV